MPKLQVLVGENGDVLATFRPHAAPVGRSAPAQAGLRAGPGQRVVELDVDETLTRLDPDELHRKIKTDHLR